MLDALLVEIAQAGHMPSQIALAKVPDLIRNPLVLFVQLAARL